MVSRPSIIVAALVSAAIIAAGLSVSADCRDYLDFTLPAIYFTILAWLPFTIALVGVRRGSRFLKLLAFAFAVGFLGHAAYCTDHILFHRPTPNLGPDTGLTVHIKPLTTQLAAPIVSGIADHTHIALQQVSETARIEFKSPSGSFNRNVLVLENGKYLFTHCHIRSVRIREPTSGPLHTMYSVELEYDRPVDPNLDCSHIAYGRITFWPFGIFRSFDFIRSHIDLCTMGAERRLASG